MVPTSASACGLKQIRTSRLAMFFKIGVLKNFVIIA